MWNARLAQFILENLANYKKCIKPELFTDHMKPNNAFEKNGQLIKRKIKDKEKRRKKEKIYLSTYLVTTID